MTAVNTPRPWVAATSVLPAVHVRSSTETLAGPSLAAFQVVPRFSLANRPTSVPAYSQVACVGWRAMPAVGGEMLAG